MHTTRAALAAAPLLALLGCVEPWILVGDSGLLGIGATSPAPTAPLNGGPTVVSSSQAQMLNGTASGRGQFRLFDVGASSAGDEWTVSWGGAPYSATPFIVTLFDHNNELLSRAVVSAGGELRHVMRTDVPRATIGIAPANGSNGGSFSFAARRRTGMAVPVPAAQVVWLNFGGGNDVRVHGRSGVSFGAFDAAALGPDYAGETALIRDAIVAEVRADYSPYNVFVYSSHEGPAPAEAHTVIHFGGYDTSLLGLADNVDQYNAIPAQTAVIYTDAFAAYHTMKLEPAEFAVMIANVASHELGHLLGLYHTKNPDDVMDTTGSAWDLAGEQWFGSVALEPTVFPTGLENSPLRLGETVGVRPEPPPAEAAAGKGGTVKPQIRELIRNFTQEELHHACGICVDLDGRGSSAE